MEWKVEQQQQKNEKYSIYSLILKCVGIFSWVWTNLNSLFDFDLIRGECEKRKKKEENRFSAYFWKLLTDKLTEL